MALVQPSSDPSAEASGWDFALADDGATTRAINLAAGRAEFSSADSAAALAYAIGQLGTNGGGIIARKGLYRWSSIPTLPRLLTRRLEIAFAPGAVAQAQSAAGRRFCDLAKVADYDTFRQIRLRGVVFDRNNIANPNAQEHVLFGVMPGGVIQTRLNFEDIEIDDWRILNCPVDAAHWNQVIQVVSYHPANAEGTQTHIKRVRVRRGVVMGANVGANIMGAGPAATNNINVWIDDVEVDGLYHDATNDGANALPASDFNGAAAQIGSRAMGGYGRVRNVYAKGLPDVAVEIDGFLDGWGENIHAEDCFGAALVLCNFHEAGDGTATTLTGAQTLPLATVTVASTAGFSNSGRILVGSQIVSYTGLTATTFTGCVGGTGTIADGTCVAQIRTEAQTMGYRDCHASRRALSTESVVGAGAAAGSCVYAVGDAGQTTQPEIGRLVFENVTWDKKTTDLLYYSAGITDGIGVRGPVREVIVDGAKLSTRGFNYTAVPSRTHSMLDLNLDPVTGGPIARLNGIHNLPVATVTVDDTTPFRAASATNPQQILVGGQLVTYTGLTATTFTGCTGGSGAIPDGAIVAQVMPTVVRVKAELREQGVQAGGAGNIVAVPFRIQGTGRYQPELELTVDSALAGLPAAGLFAAGIFSGAGVAVDPRVKMIVRRVLTPSDARGFQVAAGVVAGRAHFVDSDFAALPAGGTEVFFGNAATRRLAIFDRPVPITYPAANVAVTVTASPFQYENTGIVPQLVTVGTNAATISQISLSRGGAAFQDTFLLLGSFLLDPGDFIQVTYSAGLPKVTVFPLR